MPLDADARRILELAEATGEPPIDTLTPDEARAMTAAAVEAGGATGADVASVVHRDVAEVPCLVVTPHGEGPWPLLVWFHGGGWVLGTADLTLHTARDLAATSGCVVVSADYRLAPEHRFPAAYDDALAVTTAVLDAADSFGGERARVAVGGDSAGGNLAAGAALAVPGLRYQLLAYPVVDATPQAANSSVGDGYLLTAGMMRWFLDHYLGDADPRDPRMSPLLAPDGTVGSTCPAHVVIAGHDPLRDQDEAYAARLVDAGVPTVVSRYPGQMHGFFTMGDDIPTGAAALAEAAALLSAAMGEAELP